MRDLKKKYRDEFGNINPTEEQREKMLNNILNHKTNNMYMRLAVVSCSIIILCIFGITNANDIKKSFNSLIINYKENRDEDGNKYKEIITSYDGVFELNYDANLVERESWVEALNKNLKMSYSNYDLELILGAKLLKSPLFNFSYSINVLRKNEGKISYMKLYSVYSKYSGYDEDYDRKLLEQASLNAQFKTKYYKGGDEFDLNVRNYYSVKNYYINSLDTTALIIRLNERGNHYLVIFSHNNVRYNFYYDNYESLIDDDKVLDRVHRILDSFYY